MLDSVNLFWLLHMLQLVSLFDLSIFLELMTCIDFIYDVNWRHEFPACTNGGVKYRTFREAVERFPKLRKMNILLEKVKN